MKEKEKKVTGIIQEVIEEICDHICKYPDIYGKEAYEDMLNKKCDECPLNKL